MKLSNLKVGTRLTLGFALLLATCAIVGFVGWSRLNHLEDSLKNLATRQWKAAHAALVIDIRQRDNYGQSGALLVADESGVRGILDEIRKNKEIVTSAFELLEGLVVDPQGRELLDRMSQARKEYLEEIGRIAADIQTGHRDKAIARYQGEAKQGLSGVQQAVEALVQHQDASFEATYQQSSIAASRARGVIIAVVGLAILAGLLVSWLLARSVVRPLRHAVEVTKAIRDGKLDNIVDVSHQDETGQVLASLDAMQSALRARDDKDADSRGQIAAIGKAQAVIEFDLEGKVLAANGNFQNLIGYSLDEITGKNHSMFVEAAYAASPEYRSFWQRLQSGEYDTGQYKRLGKHDREVWIQASYNPITDARGRVVKVVEYATDITEQKLRNADFEGQLAAIGKAQAIIEFDLDGTVRTANENFLRTLGYSLGEVQGRHHSTFVDPEALASNDYHAFWQKLGRGEFDSGQYKRLGKGGRPIWIQASYNPIFDASGRPYKVVKYASDVTAQVLLAQQLKDAVTQSRETVKLAIDGDLTRRIPLDGKTGEIEALCRGLNSLLDSTASLVMRVKTASIEVQQGAEEISKGNMNLSQRTEEQASSLEETASSMEEMTSTVRQTADNAAQASQLALAAREQATQGGVVVSSAVAAMGGINEASKKIAEIIGVIDEIAFQTNLLALNAAVEAARAGEQGRGFAVVASEVRSLAGRSATAAKQIKALIQNSGAKVEEGSRLVDESGRTLEKIITAIKKVTDIVAEIAAASREQSLGIDQVNKAVGQMDTTTQQNAALVEEAASASQAIAEQTQALARMIAHFRLGSLTSTGSATQSDDYIAPPPTLRVVR
jgi:methyl-accepting chemotaxis protein